MRRKYRNWPLLLKVQENDFFVIKGLQIVLRWLGVTGTPSSFYL